MDNVIMEMTKSWTPHSKNQEMRKLVEKWSRTGLLNKLDEHRKTVIARLLETQALDMRRTIEEASLVGNVAGFSKIAFPLVRRAFGQLLAHEIVSVQPMAVPGGLVFFLDFKVDRTKSGLSNGNSLYGNLNNTPPNNNSGLDGVGEQTASGGFYNLITGYSKRSFLLTGATAPVYSGVTANSTLLGNVTVSGYNFTLASSAATDLKSLHEIRMVKYGELNLDAANTFRSLSALHSLTGGTMFNQIDWTMTTVTAGVLQVFSNLAGYIDNAWTQTSVTAVHLAGPAKTTINTESGTNSLGDFESTSAIPEVNISISSISVVAQTRKLKATWTPELAQDLNAFHSLDAEAELTVVLSETITTEVDRDILGQLLWGAAVRAAWSRSIGHYVQIGANETINTLTPTNSYTYQNFHGSQQDWYQTLGETINVVSNEIHKRNLRSGANWIVTSPDVASIIESIGTFRPDTQYNPTEVKYSLGIEKTGTLTSRFTVYKDPYFPADRILLGYKGGGDLDAGFIYAPYVPLIVTPTVLDPATLTPVKGIMHRSATQMVRPEMYGAIKVLNLNIIGH